MRASRLLPLLCLAVTTCGAPVVSAGPSPVERRALYLDRDVAFIYDTIPILRFDVPYVYAMIRFEVERCSGLHREGWPTFYVAPKNPLPGMVLAFYTEDTQSIVFALGSESNAQTISHELIHFLLAPHVAPKKQPGETYSDFLERVHPDSIYAPAPVGKCGALLHPTD